MCHWQFGSQVQKLTFQVCRAAGVIPHGCTKHICVNLETGGCISIVLFWYVRVNSDHHKAVATLSSSFQLIVRQTYMYPHIRLHCHTCCYTEKQFGVQYSEPIKYCSREVV